MSRRLLGLLLVSAAIACSADPSAPEPPPRGLLKAPAPATAPDPDGEVPEAPEPEEMEGFLSDANQRTVQLFFPGEDGRWLVPEERIIFLTATLNSQIKQAVSELLLGPQEENGLPAFPPRTRLLAIFLLDDGTAVIDLGREAQAIPAGSDSELTAIYALANTVGFNFPGVERVRILIEGEEAATLSGHVDLSRPIAADLGWVDWGLAGPPPAPAGAEPPSDRWTEVPRGDAGGAPSPPTGGRSGPI